MHVELFGFIIFAGLSIVAAINFGMRMNAVRSLLRMDVADEEDDAYEYEAESFSLIKN